MKSKKSLFIVCIAIPLIVGVLAGLITRNSIEVFAVVEKPPLAPPAWVFPVVWTILYILMGISSYIILTSNTSFDMRNKVIKLYAYQLVVNFLWPTFFFNYQWYLFSFLWLLLLWALVFLMIKSFYEISKLAAYLNAPYLIWLSFAGYLNAGIWLLNR